MYDKIGNLVFEPKQGTWGPERDDINESKLTLKSNETLVGVRGDLTHHFSGRQGYWRDIEFIIADSDD